MNRKYTKVVLKIFFIAAFIFTSGCVSNMYISSVSVIDYENAEIVVKKKSPSKKWGKYIYFGRKWDNYKILPSMEKYLVRNYPDYTLKRARDYLTNSQIKMHTYMEYRQLIIPNNNLDSINIKFSLSNSEYIFSDHFRRYYPWVSNISGKEHWAVILMQGKMTVLESPSFDLSHYGSFLDTKLSLPDRIKIEIEFIDPISEMPIINAIAEVNTLSAYDYTTEVNKIFAEAGMRKRIRSNQKHQYKVSPGDFTLNTDRDGKISFWILPYTNSNEIKFDIRVRTYGRTPIKATIENNSVEKELSYKIEWPENPINVQIVDDHLNPVIIKK